MDKPYQEQGPVPVIFHSEKLEMLRKIKKNILESTDPAKTITLEKMRKRLEEELSVVSEFRAEVSQPEIVEINGRKFAKKFIGDQLGLDDQPLTEKRYYSHEGPGWDYRFGYLEDMGKMELEELSDEPYIYTRAADKS